MSLPQSSGLTVTEPPTPDSLHNAKLHLAATNTARLAVDAKIADAEAALAQMIADAKSAMNKLVEEQHRLQGEEEQTKAYLSTIRRLPAELLREIFMWNFEAHASCAWVLASVCSSWRRIALRTPRLWAKVRLVTTPTSSPELIRLWLERSGHNVPLDIEIYLRVAADPASTYPTDAQRRRRRRSSSNTSSAPSWLSFASHNGIATSYVVPTHPYPQPNSQLQLMLAALPPAPMPAGPPTLPWPTPAQDSAGLETRTPGVNRPNIHWAHIAFFYLVEQMPRWERFVFRYDKAFKSMTALASINGDAPLLKEFEVSSAEGGCTGDWPWLPNIATPDTPHLPNLTSLTLHQVPFKWSSPLFSLPLTHLNLRAPLNPTLPLDRIRYMIAQTPTLESLSLYFPGVLPHVLPMNELRLDRVRELRVGGHCLLAQLVDVLVLPALKSLSLLVDPREPVEDLISGLLTRSASPQLEELSLGYDSPCAHPFSFPSHPHHTHAHPHHLPSFMYYLPPTGLISSWRLLLSRLPSLHTLRIGGTPVESLLTALGSNDDIDGSGVNGWVVPRLEVLKMRCGPGPGCGALGGFGGHVGQMQAGLYSEGVGKLVQFVEARNPEPGGSGGSGGGGGNSTLAMAPTIQAGGVARLKYLEVQDCELGQDVERWLGGRVENVVVACRMDAAAQYDR
ncbi:hypothetical protein P691DRAFT_684604 [Macrolepiota fuliginosa MF-IS2]|uniref:F-box domain-containing protein n=1 Tax=Macrolepiota fuliginosa MF-IS2 TaxID=1400762 RepID=A0A9P6BVX7_9AGAR|nr:hypothetical protein P691DRAFT_684604 [Macrolepiota fuliginosa MF-IS2]